MNKGFTLIELLMVVIIVGVLVTVSLPKYHRAMERGRALEGINNARMAADYASARHMADESVCPVAKDLIRNRFFAAPQVSCSGDSATASVTRSGGDWEYTITATVEAGEVSGITCAPQDACTEIGFEEDLMNK